MIYTVRVTSGKEKSVLDQLASIKNRGEYE